MKYKIIIPIIIISFLLGLYGIYKYKEYLDFLDLYEKSEYTQILDDQILDSPEMLHNYGIVAFDVFKESGMSEIDKLVESNLLFSGSLQKQEHEKTRYQYEFTKALLNLFQIDLPEEKPEDQNQDDQQGEEGESEENTDEGEGGQEENSDSQSQNGRDSQYFLQEGEEIEPLSDAEMEKLQKNIQELKSEQMKNQQFYGKQEQLSPFMEAFDSVFGTVDRGGEKDW